MEKQINRILAAAVLVTAAVYAFLVIDALSLDPGDHTFRLLMWSHAVPCFFLQLLVCRAAERSVIRLIPVFLLLGLAAWFAAGFFTAAGWDNLGWGLLLLLCAAPAAGCAAAWTVYGVQRGVHRLSDR